MTGWMLLWAPLLLLPLVLLLRFVGCGETLDAPADPPAPEKEPPPRYPDFILGLPNNPGPVKHSNFIPDGTSVIGYWRLLDVVDLKSPPASRGAADQKGFQKGVYEGTPLGPDVAAASEFALGTLEPGAALLLSEPFKVGHFFNGAFVRVAFKPGLFTQDFTIEAWLDPQWGKGNAQYEHTLFSAGGVYRDPADPSFLGDSGFRLFATKDNRWQVSLSGSGTGLFPPTLPRVPRQRTHVALTVAFNTSTQRSDLTLFVDGVKASAASAAYTIPPAGTALLIGVDSRSGDPNAPLEPYRPVLSHLQEVVLHNRRLPAEEIENHVFINAAAV